jgi:ubiquinone/menaquinone biosynthesis C-methylase UbiE
MPVKENNLVKSAFEQREDYDATIKKEVESLTSIKYEDFLTRLVDRAAPRAGEEVLDVATGTAEIAINLVRRTEGSLRVTGIDLTSGMLQRAAGRVEHLGLGGQIRLLEGSGMELPFAEKTFDLATCSMAMHHMQVEKALEEMIRVLKPGGRLVIADMGASPGWRKPAGSVLIRIALFLYQAASFFNTKSRAEAAAFGQCFTAGEWEQILSAVGLSSYRVEEHAHPRRAWYPRLLFVTAQK